MLRAYCEEADAAREEFGGSAVVVFQNGKFYDILGSEGGDRGCDVRSAAAECGLRVYRRTGGGGFLAAGIPCDQLEERVGMMLARGRAVVRIDQDGPGALARHRRRSAVYTPGAPPASATGGGDAVLLVLCGRPLGLRSKSAPQGVVGGAAIDSHTCRITCFECPVDSARLAVSLVAPSETIVCLPDSGDREAAAGAAHGFAWGERAPGVVTDPAVTFGEAHVSATVLSAFPSLACASDALPPDGQLCIGPPRAALASGPRPALVALAHLLNAVYRRSPSRLKSLELPLPLPGGGARLEITGDGSSHLEAEAWHGQAPVSPAGKRELRRRLAAPSCDTAVISSRLCAADLFAAAEPLAKAARAAARRVGDPERLIRRLAAAPDLPGWVSLHEGLSACAEVMRAGRDAGLDAGAGLSSVEAAIASLAADAPGCCRPQGEGRARGDGAREEQAAREGPAAHHAAPPADPASRDALHGFFSGPPELLDLGEQEARAYREVAWLVASLCRSCGALPGSSSRTECFRLEEWRADGRRICAVTVSAARWARSRGACRALVGAPSDARVDARLLPPPLSGFSLEAKPCSSGRLMLQGGGASRSPDDDAVGALLSRLASLRDSFDEALSSALAARTQAMLAAVGCLLPAVCASVAGIDIAAASALAKLASEADSSSPPMARPVVLERCDESGSMLCATGLRHPALDVLPGGCTPNDFAVGSDRAGAIIFGANGSGKSCLMKAVGLAVIYAQAGLYVPAAGLTIRPFSALFTRFPQRDSIERARSTFVAEMSEVSLAVRDAHRIGSSMLVIGDELACGTNHISATAIVSAGISMLAQHGARFIFTTHLLDLPAHVPPGVRVCHMAIRVRDGRVDYTRRLQEGADGTDNAIEVCEALGFSAAFLELAHAARRSMLSGPVRTIIPARLSRYNRRKIVDRCEACGGPATEVHHKVPRSAGGGNRLQNLASLCESCHRAEHRPGA
jgi:hypothetical protein